MDLNLRKFAKFVDKTFIEGGKKAKTPVLLVSVAAVIKNPWIDRGFVEDLKPEILALAPKLGDILVPELIKEIGNQHIIIADAKRGDIGNSAAHYANAFFKHFDCDAITVNPYMGEETIKPFSIDSSRGVYVLCVTSNSSAEYIQNDTFKNVINLTNDINENKNIGLVVGATDMHKMKEVRSLSTLPFLITGIGAQGGDLENTVNINKEFIDSTLVNVSRSIIFADNKDSNSIHNAAKEFSEQMRKYCER